MAARSGPVFKGKEFGAEDAETIVGERLLTHGHHQAPMLYWNFDQAGKYPAGGIEVDTDTDAYAAT